MPFVNLSSLKRFRQFLSSLGLSRKFCALSFTLLALMYPGHNSLQTLMIEPGSVLALPLSTSLTTYPLSDNVRPPDTSALAVIVQDVASKTILFGHNLDAELMPASTTKLMTALVAKNLYSLDELVTITAEDHAVGHTMNLSSGEVLSVRDLLYGLLVESGNDAALALATHHPEGYTGFVAAMNSQAQTLRLTHTSYRNPSGVENYLHHTSVRDLAVLASSVAIDPLLAEIVSTKESIITSRTGQVHHLVNTNELLGEVEGVRGMKTGWTEHAGECLVTYVEREGRGVIIVVLGSTDRFGDSAKLIDWVYTHHTWVNPN